MVHSVLVSNFPQCCVALEPQTLTTNISVPDQDVENRKQT